MNAGAAVLNVASMLTGQGGADGGATAAAAAGPDDFTLALAEAAAPQALAAAAGDPALPVPEGTEAAAALAFLAHLMPMELRQQIGTAEAVPEGEVLPGMAAASAGATDRGLLLTALTQGAAQIAAGSAANAGKAPATVADAQSATSTPGLALPELLTSLPEARGDAGRDAMDALASAARLLSSEPPAATSAQGGPSLLAAPSLYGPSRDAAIGATVSAAVKSTVGTPRWADELGSHMVMMSVRGQQEGSLSLSPEHLGPLEVRISMGQDGANVWFGAQHADTRAALQDALPRLREMFTASGLALGHAGVSQDMPRQEAREAAMGLARQRDDIPAATTETAAPAGRRVSSALLDAWA